MVNTVIPAQQLMGATNMLPAHARCPMSRCAQLAICCPKYSLFAAKHATQLYRGHQHAFAEPVKTLLCMQGKFMVERCTPDERLQ